MAHPSRNGTSLDGYNGYIPIRGLMTILQYGVPQVFAVTNSGTYYPAMFSFVRGI